MPEAPSFAELAAGIDASAAKGEAMPAIDTAAPKVAAPETPPAKPATPETKPATPPETPAKEETTVSKLMGKKEKSTTPKEVAKTDEKPIDWKTAPKEFRDRFEQLSTEHKTVAQKAQDFEKKVSEYETRIKEIESKKGETSQADLKLVEEYTKKISDYEKTIQELDYSRGPEYTTLRSDYQAKFNQAYISAATELKGFSVTTGQDENGNPVTRQFSDADMQALSGKTVAEQRRMTRAMFGADADVANSHLDELRRISNEANFTLSKKLEDAKQNGEKRTAEQRLSEQKQQEEYNTHLKATQEQLETEYPDLLKPPTDDPEGAEALTRGFKFVDEALGNVGKMTLKDRAEYNAVLRARAAASFFQDHKIEKLSSQVESLTKELEGLRGADPGKGGANPQPAAKVDESPSFAAFAKQFDDAVQ